MRIRKPDWFDASLGLAGFVLSAAGLLSLVVDNRYLYRVAIIATLVFFALLIIVAFAFGPRHSVRTLEAHRAKRRIERLSKQAEEIVIANPAAPLEYVQPVIAHATGNDVPLSVVGDAMCIEHAFKELFKEASDQVFPATRISSASSSWLLLCFVRRGRKRVDIVAMDANAHYLITVIDEVLVGMLVTMLKREAQERRDYIKLSSVVSPTALMGVIRNEQMKYLRNFQSLQTGYVSFYGTEVQTVQSGWVESGEFQNIDTLDMTTNPRRLLSRQRYNNANRTLIAGGGRVRRVYMVQARALHHAEFADYLAELVRVQKEIGVEVGLVEIDTIPLQMRKDFILYDDSIVLVEDQQANADYTLGRSTAYFSATEIANHRTDFNDVWAGRYSGLPPTEFADEWLSRSNAGPARIQ